MSDVGIEKLGTYLESWIQSAPGVEEVDDVTRDAQAALIEAGMVQYNPDGWDFKLHETHPDAPKAQFKLMIREAPGVNTDPAYYGRFTLPSVLQLGEAGGLDSVTYVLGYPNAGTPIASAFARLAKERLGIELIQLEQAKTTHADGTRELGDIKSPYAAGETVLAVDDTATGGDTKIEGWQKITQHGLSYAGLALLIERDPLSSALIRERTGEGVYPSMHWLSVVRQAGKILGLPDAAIQQELAYPLRLFEWNVEHGKSGRLPSPNFLARGAGLGGVGGDGE
jgi:orotate phosphoribosyltransferase